MYFYYVYHSTGGRWDELPCNRITENNNKLYDVMEEWWKAIRRGGRNLENLDDLDTDSVYGTEKLSFFIIIISACIFSIIIHITK